MKLTKVKHDHLLSITAKREVNGLNEKSDSRLAPNGRTSKNNERNFVYESRDKLFPHESAIFVSIV
jgi:hypothetical protein